MSMGTLGNADGTTPSQRRARGAVIIPAHDEAAVIARTLAPLAPLAERGRIEVVVACNGCSDDTAAISRAFPGVVVVETDEGSKPAGLNLGDAAATAWPRLYLDADIEIAPAAVLAVFDALQEPGVLAARPAFVYDTAGASGPVRAYYRARTRIPGQPARLWGAGGYAANQAGHGRFASFPAVTADDSWFDAQFTEDEKRIVDTTPMQVRTPRDAAALVSVLARQRRGYVEIGIAPTTASRAASLLRAVRTPRDASDALWYALLTALARRRARSASGGDVRPAWERDASTREGAEAIA
ncbi:glycosyltransferase family 2 protein [Microbacterium sp. 179-B 1A2 NHS]|uniref:glycosyltransferase n=1 Tax=Microbacterium sp. 179-B 1A2 NHS TaxID=3142383 RepID=UPI0039A32995